jgi:peptidoglycan/xylan/chitin deacetylase (PgdA/CDA1 family)
MDFSNAVARIRGKMRRLATTHLGRRTIAIEDAPPIVSFSFDDAPKSAFGLGREILAGFGAKPTYYVSLGLLDSETEVGRIGNREDLVEAVGAGCELACHTYDHLDAWETPLEDYMISVEKNGRALKDILPDASFATFAYPKSGPTLAAKMALANHFGCCRAGGQEPNLGSFDAGVAKSAFLDSRTGADEAFANKLIDETIAKNGWLIFATHDIDSSPSPYGCTPDLLEAVARYAHAKGALFLPVGEAFSRLSRGGEAESQSARQSA